MPINVYRVLMIGTMQSFLNILAPFSRVLCVLVCGMGIARWVCAVMGESDFGLDGGVGGMTLMTLLACTMGLIRVGSAAVCLSMGFDPMYA